MSEKGGHAEKAGNRYETLWVAKQLLRLASGQLLEVQSEPLGTEEQGIDVCLKDSAGRRFLCQCKMGNAGSNNWPMGTLAARGVLAYLRSQLTSDPLAQYRFVSGVPAIAFQELSQRARDNPANPSLWLQAQVRGNKRYDREFQTFCKHLAIDPAKPDDLAFAYDLLKRSNMISFQDNDETREDLRARIHQLFQGDLDAGLSHIRAMVADSLRRVWRQDDVLDAMRTAGFPPRLFDGDDRCAPALDRLWATFESSIEPFLLGGRLLARTQARQILDQLTAGARLVAVQAPSGFGKSCILYEAARALRADGVPVLALRLDRQRLQQNLETYGSALGLPGSPHFTLGRFAADRRGVLILDQLDALQWTGHNSASEMAAFKTLCREALQYPSLSVVVACRTFDVQNDPFISAWMKASRAKEITVGQLDESVARDIATRACRPWDALTGRQKRLLLWPQALALWLDSASAPAGFSTVSELMREYWRLKWRVLAADGAEQDARTVIQKFIEHIRSHTEVSMPSRRVDQYPRAVSLLRSHNVLVESGDRLSFAHESLADFLTADDIVTRVESSGVSILSTLPPRDDQSLYVRHQLRHVLDLLRPVGGLPYRKAVGDLLFDPGVRFHLRHLVLNWLGSLVDPTDAEQRIVDDAWADNTLRDHVRDLVYAHNEAWMSRLFRRGDPERWVQSANPEGIDTAFWLMHTVRDACGDEISAVLRGGDLTDPTWQRHALYLLPYRPEGDSDSLFSVRLELARAGMATEMHFWPKLAQSSPHRCAALLCAFADGLLLHLAGGAAKPIGASVLHGPMPFALGHAGAHLNDADCREVLQRLLRLREVATHRGSQSVQAVDNTLSALSCMLVGAAFRNSARVFDADFPPLAAEAPDLFAAALAHASAGLAGRCVDWLEQAPSRLAHFGRPGDGCAVAGACRLLRRLSRIASSSDRGRLEALARNFRGEDELESIRHRHSLDPRRDLSRPNSVGLGGFLLLDALDANRLSPPALAEYEMRRRKFGDPSQYLRRDHLRGGSVRSPVSDRIRRLSDDAWLGIVRDVSLGDHRWRRRDGDVLVSSDPAEFASDMRRISQLQPERFAGLALRFAPDRPLFLDAVLCSVAAKRPPDFATPPEREAWRSAADDSVERLLVHINHNWDPSFAISFARAVRAYPQATADAAVIERLLALTRDPDPLPGERPLTLGGDRDGKEAFELETSAINCTRGCAADAISALITERPELAPGLADAVATLAQDPHPAVRVAAFHLAASTSALSQRDAIDLFIEIATGTDEHVKLTHTFNRILQWAFSRDTSRIEALVHGMVQSTDSEVARAGAYHATSANVVLGCCGPLAVACKTGSRDHRIGVASAAASLFGESKFVSLAIPILRTCLVDTDSAVRAEARSCFRRHSWQDDEAASAFAAECGEIDAIQQDPEALVLALHEWHGDLRRHAALVFSACKAYSGRLAAETRSIQNAASAGAHWLGPVVFRLYEQCRSEGDVTTRRRCLDEIDQLLAAQVGIGTDLARTFDS